MTSLVSNAMSPTKDGTSSLPRRQSSFARPPLRVLYDLLIAPMEGVSAPRLRGFLVSECIIQRSVPSRFSRAPSSLSSFSASI